MLTFYLVKIFLIEYRNNTLIKYLDYFYIFRNFFLYSVNQESLLKCTHDEAVGGLRSAGDEVVLTVRHYKAATPFLNKGKTATKGSSPKNLIQ